MSSRRITFLIDAVNNAKGPLGETKSDLERLKAANADLANSVNTQMRSISLLNKEYKLQNYELYQAFGLLRNVGAVGNTLVSIVNSQNLAAINLRDAQRDLADAEAYAAQQLEIYGDKSVPYLAALDDVKEKAEDVKTAQDNILKTDITTAFQMAGAVGQVGNLVSELNKAVTNAGGLQAALTLLATNPVTVTVAIAVVGAEVLEWLAGVQQKQLDARYGAAPSEAGKPGEEGVVGVWPGVYLDKDLGKWYQEQEVKLQTTNKTININFYGEVTTVDEGALTDSLIKRLNELDIP